MPNSILFVFRKRLNFVLLMLSLIGFFLYSFL